MNRESKGTNYRATDQFFDRANPENEILEYCDEDIKQGFIRKVFGILAT